MTHWRAEGKAKEVACLTLSWHLAQAKSKGIILTFQVKALLVEHETAIVAEQLHWIGASGCCIACNGA